MSVPEDGQMLATLEGEGGPLDIEQRVLLWGMSALLVVMAGLMSGLTIGLMAMDDMEMEVRLRAGRGLRRCSTTRFDAAPFSVCSTPSIGTMYITMAVSKLLCCFPVPFTTV